MHLKSLNVMLCGVAALIGLAATAQAQQASYDQMAQELATLRQEVAQLKADTQDNWLNERRAEEVKALISEVLADAETRASLQDTGMTAGYNKHFFLASADGKFLMELSGQLQFRYIYNNRENLDADGANTDYGLSGFQFRRGKLQFAGHIGDPKLMYKFRLATDRDNGDAYLDEATIAYKVMDNLTIAGGRTKAPLLREELTSSKYQLAVERSLVNETFTGGYVEGVLAYWQPIDMLKVAAAITDGAGTGEYNSGMDFNNVDSDFAVTARADVKLAGEWGQMKDFAAWSGQPMAAFIGGGVHYEVGETGAGAQEALDDFFVWTIDGSIEYEGLNLYAAFMGLHTDAADDAPAGTEADHYGLVVQGGYMVVPDTLEPFVRYELLMLDDDAITAGLDDDLNIITAGVNYYIKKHDAKFTLDVVWLLDSTNGYTSAFGTGSISDGLGLAEDATGKEDQMAIRAQFQLLF
jgi:hypothetical protein